MRKILASMMAASMVASICATASFAAVTKTKPYTTVAVGTAATAGTAVTAVLVVDDGTDVITYEVALAEEAAIGGDTTSPAKAMDKVIFNDVKIDNKRFTVKATNSAASKVKFELQDAVALSTAAQATELNFDLLKADGDSLLSTKPTGDTFAIDAGVASPGTGDMTADIEFAGDLEKVDIKNVIECDGEGNPIPLTEKTVGVDKDQNGSQGVQSNKTLYFMVKKGDYSFNNEDYWKLKVTKGDNAKIIKAVSDVSKNFSSNLFDAVKNTEVKGTSGRNRFIKVELNELYTDTEYKVSLDMRLSAKSGATRVFGVKEESEIKVNDFTFYVKNITKTADNDWLVGINGLMLDPIGNDWNNVTYHDEDTDVAFVKFFGDSDVGKFYAKLSTKWAHEDYAAYFNDQDAFYFEFTGSPKLSSTSRADLQIYNPFTDEDGNETIDPTTATIYQVVDGDLIDITDSFTYGEAENGEDAFLTRTRFLGTYIICEKPVEEATGDADIEDIVPSDDAEVTTPDGNNDGKAPANTGRYA